MPASNSLQAALEQTFSFGSFRTGQEEAAQAILDGRDLVAVMPTGFGKSLCYQLPATMLEGTTVVISPLIALMKDQVDALTRIGIPAAAIHSSMPESARQAALKALEKGLLRLVYAAPERLTSPRFQDAITRAGVSRMIVDEAHCISQWGHDFRPDYRRLGPLRQQLGVPAAAFTATATPQVRRDITTQLGLDQPLELVTGFDRPNLTLGVLPVRSRLDKQQAVARALTEWGTPGIVYGSTRKNVEAWGEFLVSQGLKASCYHAGVSDKQREEVQDAFLEGRLDAIAATNAFGMGIDKPDIRCVIHGDIPGSVEAYYQEAGRAGRDGNPSLCLLLFSPADIRTQEFFLAGSNPPPALFHTVWEMLGSGLAEELLEQRAGGSDAATRMASATATRLLLQAAEKSGQLPGEGAMPMDLTLLRAKAKRDRKRLDAMLQYSFSRGCRTRFIYDYFAGTAAGGAVPRCGTCDICLGWQSGTTRLLTDQEYENVRIALSGVARLSGRFGQERIAQLLTGSRSREITSRSFHQLPTWGRLKTMSIGRVKDLLSVLVDAELIERRTIAGGPVGAFVLALSPLGVAVMKGDSRPEIAYPECGKKKPAQKRSQTESQKKSRRRPGRKRSPSNSPAAQPSAEPQEADLFEQLRTWRATEARRRRVPAYMVFSDATLLAVAQTRPANEGELLEIKGIGPAKAEKYGTYLLKILHE